jgi:hypothetical protein
MDLMRYRIGTDAYVGSKDGIFCGGKKKVGKLINYLYDLKSIIHFIITGNK